MKYIKKFQTNADYLSFKTGSDYVTPNVSLITVDNTIVFKPFDNTTSLITFTIDGISYNATPGMYWYEWLDSEYNTINATLEFCEHGAISVSGKELKLRSASCVKCWEDSGDAIIEGGVYYTGSWCSPF